jgi:hypothetical protein
MRRMERAVTLLVIAGLAGCASHSSRRYYDDDHHDYHGWNDQESGFYVRWETETHREHRDFQRRDADEQREYWNWRHNHS